MNKINTYYTEEKHVQILIALLKKHGIKKIIASPGTTNICFVASVQYDDYFEVYSAPDERSAAYMACGLSTESGEPVVLSCTGATASRNYVPGLTEAFYRKIPILAITSTQPVDRVGHNIPQIIDRSAEQNDIFKLNVEVSEVHNKEDFWSNEIKINKAILELKHRGGGPVHINLTTTYSPNFNVKELPDVRVINRISYNDNIPEIDGNKVGIYVGAHKKWNEKLIQAVDDFCERYNAIVFCDHTSNYKSKYRILPSIALSQDTYKPACSFIDLLIYIGDISGAYLPMNAQKSWRVNPDGEIRDTFGNLQYVFEMEEVDFFKKYVVLKGNNFTQNTLFDEWKVENDKFFSSIPDLPFSNPWIAQQTAMKIPENSVLHLGILNSLRSWNYFEIPNSVLGYSNTGGFGIDGNVSSLIGASLSNPHKLFIGIIGDLAFFYDMNSLGNRHVGKNIRLMLINNACGTEFKNYNHPGAKFKDEANAYIAAAGHYGNKSHLLIKHYAEDLGFRYISAQNKEEYMNNVDTFLSNEINQSVIFEIFTNSENESNAHKLIRNIESSTAGTTKKIVKNILGKHGVEVVKKIMGK